MGTRYLGRKVLQAILTVFFIVVLNFLLFRLMPGSPERILLRNPNLTPATLEAARARWGLDKPLFPDQLVAYLGSTVSGDLGYSFKFRGQPVTEVIGERFWPTVLLFGLGELIAIVVGLALGAYAGWRRGGTVDRIGNGLSLILYSMPYFVIGHAADHHLRDRAWAGSRPRACSTVGGDLRLVRRPAARLPGPPGPAAGHGQPRPDRRSTRS